MTLNDVADLFRVHPRTLLRALTGQKHPYWVSGYNPQAPSISCKFNYTAGACTFKQPGYNLSIFSCLLCAYGGTAKQMQAVLDGTDQLLTRTEAARRYGRSVRVFQSRNLPALRHGQTVRYLASVVDKYKAV